MNKNIVTCVLLTIVTCGLYGIYWWYTIHEEAMKVNPQEITQSFAISYLLSIVTCGIYMFYWQYKLGRAFMPINGGKDNSILFLVLSLFGLQIVNLVIMQEDINRANPV